MTTPRSRRRRAWKLAGALKTGWIGEMVTVRMDVSGDVVLIDREWLISLGPGRVDVTVPGHEGTGTVLEDPQGD